MQTGHFNNDYVFMAQALMDHGYKGRELLNVNLTLLTPRNRILSLQSSPVAMGDLLASAIWHLQSNNSIDEDVSLVAVEQDLLDNNMQFKNVTARNLGAPIFNRADYEDENQWSRVLTLLSTNPEERNAVLHLTDKDNVFFGNNDVCPTSTAQFRIMDNMLNLVVTNTQTDFINQLPHDVFFWTIAHELMLMDLKASGMQNLTIGQFVLNSNTLYVDESQLDILAEIADDRGQDIPMVVIDTDLDDRMLNLMEEAMDENVSQEAVQSWQDSFWKTLVLSLRHGDISALHKLFGQDH